MQHFLYFNPLPQGQGSFRPTLAGFKFIRIGLMGPSPPKQAFFPLTGPDGNFSTNSLFQSHELAIT
jgi:hypothetical protein